MRKKDKNNLYYIIGGIILLIMLYFVFASFSNTFIVIQNTQDQSFSGNFDGIDFTGKTSYLGSLTSGSGKAIISCGQENDGGIAISNSYSDGDSLILISSIGTGNRDCDNVNYINTEFNLPIGILKGECDLTASASKSISTAKSICNVEGLFSLTAEACDNTGGCPQFDTQVQSFELTITKPTAIKVSLETEDSSSGKIILDFEAKSVDTLSSQSVSDIPIESNSNIPLQNIILEDRKSISLELLFLLVSFGIFLVLLLIFISRRFK